MPSTLTTPWEFAAGLLSVAETALGTTIGGEIPRAFVSPGLPALDCCPQLTVHCVGFNLLPTSPSGALDAGHRRRYGRVNSVHMVITVVRCSPTLTEGGGTPSMDEQEDAARAHLQDAFSIIDAVFKADKAGDVFGGGCSEVFFEGATPLDPSGGCVGWTIRWGGAIQGLAPA